MLFSSITFLFYFLPILMLLYYLFSKEARNWLLLVASLVFYSWGEPVYVVLMIFSGVFNYVMAKDIAREKKMDLEVHDASQMHRLRQAKKLRRL